MNAAGPADVPADDGSGEVVAWATLLEEAARSLQVAGVEHAVMDARRIVAAASGVEVSDMPFGLDRPASVRGVAHLDDMVRRRSAGEPLQYVLGSWGFRTLDLMVDRRVLIPRPETESVVDFALTELDRVGGAERATAVVDIGTGSGAIALSIAVERPRSEVWGLDVSEDALAVARANTAGIGRAGSRVRMLHSDLFNALPADMRGQFDLVVSNPPYVAARARIPGEVSEWEPALALWGGDDGTDILVQLLQEAPSWLTPDGALVMELSPEQAPTMEESAAAVFDSVAIGDDLSGRARALIARRPR